MKVFIPAYFVTSGHSVQKWEDNHKRTVRTLSNLLKIGDF